MPLDIKITKGANPKAIIVALTGSLDTATSPELEKQLTPALGKSVADVAFDLAGLKFISSAGLRVFQTARKTVKERGGQASFVNMQPQIKQVFDIIKALPGVSVFKNVEEMDRYLAARQRAVIDKKPLSSD